MLQFGNTIIMAGVDTIIRQLKTYIQGTGNDTLLKEIKSSGDSLMVSCPFHKSGGERRPSCGVLLCDKNGVKAGTFHCFTCGEKGDLIKFINKVLGQKIISSAGLKWMLKRFDLAEIHNRELNLDLARKATGAAVKYVQETELEKYRFYHDYMYKRKLTNEIIEKFDIGFDAETQCLTFPVRDELGRTVLIGRRSVTTKFFNYPKGIEKPLYGLYELGKKNYKEIWVVESIINALTLWGYGIPAVATYSVNFSRLHLAQLQALNTRSLVLAYDGDEAGYNAVYGRKDSEGRWRPGLASLLKKTKLVLVAQLPKGKDINDLSRAEVLALNTVWA